MATAVDPFSFVAAEVSEKFVGEFPHPDIVPKYLETVRDETGVQIVSGVSTLTIRGSWVSLTKVHSFLSDFLASFQNADSDDGHGNCVASDCKGKPGKRKIKRSLSDDDNYDDAFDLFRGSAFAPEGQEKPNLDYDSSWSKFTAEVLPQIQRTRSKRGIVFAESKDTSHKVPEPFVLVANFQPPSDPTAKKIPNLTDIERVLKKVYEKDSLAATVTPTSPQERKLTSDSDEQSFGNNNLIPTQLSSETGQWLNSNGDDDHKRSVDLTVAGDSSDSTSGVTGPPSFGLQLSYSSHVAGIDSKLDIDTVNQYSGIIPDQHMPLPAELANEVSEKQGQSLNCLAEAVCDNSSGPVLCNFISTSKEGIITADGPKHGAVSSRVNRRKGWPKKKVRPEENKTKSVEISISELKSTRAERAAKRNKKYEPVVASEIGRKAKQKTNDEPEFLSKKPKRGRPSQCKSDTEDEKNYTCNECPYVAKKHTHLQEHKRRVHITKEFKCDKCGKIFGFGKDLKRHRMTHQRAENCCDICGKMYKGVRSLAEHKKTHADNYIKPTFPCEFCDKIFSTKYVLAYHIKSDHLGMKKTYICPTCGKSFSQKNSYLQHANVHMGIRPHQCDVCGKSFSYEKSLKEHKYMHDEDKQFECPICHKKFRQTSGVSIHMKIHKENKDYVCSACGKGFSQKQALVRHERIHDGEKPFSCGLCQRTFTDSSILRRHMILIHKKDPKKWREDTISSVRRKTDFFISVVGENGEASRDSLTESSIGVAHLDSSDELNPLVHAATGTTNSTGGSMHKTLTQSGDIQTRSEEDSFSFMLVSMETRAPQILASAFMHAANAHVFPADGSLAESTLPSMTTANLPQSVTFSQRAGSEEPRSSFIPVSLPSAKQLIVLKPSQPLDMSSQGQGESQLQGETDGPKILSSIPYGDRLPLVPASDFYPGDVQGVHMHYSGQQNPTVNVSGTYRSPVMNNMLPHCLNTPNFQSDPILDMSSASQSKALEVEQPADFEHLAAHSSMQVSSLSPGSHQ